MYRPDNGPKWMYWNGTYYVQSMYRSRTPLCTELVLDMYRSCFVPKYRTGSPYVPKWSCTELVLPQWIGWPVAEISPFEIFDMRGRSSVAGRRSPVGRQYTAWVYSIISKLTKLCHIMRNYLVHIICSKCPPSAETHAFRRLRKSLTALLIVACGKSL